MVVSAGQARVATGRAGAATASPGHEAADAIDGLVAIPECRYHARQIGEGTSDQNREAAMLATRR